MGTLVVTEFLTLDGVMEAPGGEPTHPHAGWVADFFDDEIGAYKLEEVMEAESHLLGRVTFESFAGAWPDRDGPFADKVNAMPKHVVSSTLPDDPGWNNCTVLRGDVATEVRALKDATDGVILVAGSATLLHALLEHELVDELRLMVFPVLVGGGLRPFPDTRRKQRLALRDTRTFANGVAVHAYAPG